MDALVDSEPNRLGAAFRASTLPRIRVATRSSARSSCAGCRSEAICCATPKDTGCEGATLDWDRLPERVEAVIAAHIARLPREDQELLAVASVEGEEFHAEVAARVMGIGEREAATRLSGALAKQHRLVAPVSLERRGEQRLSRYRFRHYLFQQYLYQGLDPVERARLHEEVGNTLEDCCMAAGLTKTQRPYMVDHWRADWVDGTPTAPLGTMQIAPQLARHFEMAGLLDRAASVLCIWPHLERCSAPLR